MLTILSITNTGGYGGISAAFLSADLSLVGSELKCLASYSKTPGKDLPFKTYTVYLSQRSQKTRVGSSYLEWQLLTSQNEWTCRDQRLSLNV